VLKQHPVANPVSNRLSFSLQARRLARLGSSRLACSSRIYAACPLTLEPAPAKQGDPFCFAARPWSLQQPKVPPEVKLPENIKKGLHSIAARAPDGGGSRKEIS